MACSDHEASLATRDPTRRQIIPLSSFTFISETRHGGKTGGKSIGGAVRAESVYKGEGRRGLGRLLARSRILARGNGFAEVRSRFQATH
ncbi:hypothetical protein OJAV_G00176690 [Oryzias javanicus]|uniref:Uncharacterized protein n=1 Tax=Oryzias javanicus TaxID=123683 RepID=A0A3S2MLM3_ORYJA|nr:hypothetical protein OJAV_G00176690 [Oryzias javanicus]